MGKVPLQNLTLKHTVNASPPPFGTEARRYPGNAWKEEEGQSERGGRGREKEREKSKTKDHKAKKAEHSTAEHSRAQQSRVQQSTAEYNRTQDSTEIHNRASIDLYPVLLPKP